MTALFIYAIFALLVSFVCSISESTLLSVRRPYIESLVQKNKRSGILLRQFKSDMNKPLAAILTLNTIANTIGAVGVGAQAASLFGSKAVGIASMILTMLILIFSEIIPKTLGATFWRPLAPVVAPLIRYLIFILYPFVFLAQILTMKMSGSDKIGEFSREEFAAMADIGAREGQLEAKEFRILKNLFRFRSSKVSNIMTPRTVVFCLPENMIIKDFIQHHHQTPFSRIPIYHKDKDDIVGFVLKDDILLAQARGHDKQELKELRREIKAVSSYASIAEVFEYLLNRREHLLLVVDEYGMDGIVTLEDVVETLFGLEIVDEADKTVDMQALARALWEQRARKIGIISDETMSKVNSELIPNVAQELKQNITQEPTQTDGETHEHDQRA